MERSVCSTPECGKPSRALGLCTACYQRFKRNGTVERVRQLGQHDYRNWQEHLLKTRGPGVARAYACWTEMRRRVKHPRGKNACYEGKSIDPIWDDFEVFFGEMGIPPEGMSIDRVDPTKGYGPGNCRWADATTQSRNRTYVKLSVEAAAEIRRIYRAGGISQQKLAERYGVTQPLIGLVVRGEAWRDANNPEPRNAP